jgi:hypothetical protein
VRLALGIGIGVCTGCLVGGAAWAALHLPHHRERPDSLLPSGAFLTSGEPTGEPEIEHVLADELADLVRATDEDVHGSSTAAITRPALALELRASPAMAAYGPALAGSWAHLVDALDAWDKATSKAHLAALRAAAHDVSDELASLGIGYHLEANALKDHAIVFAFRVEEVAYEHAGDVAVRVLSLRRIDRLNVEQALLGMQTDDGADPVVMLDQIDELARTKLADPSWFAVGDDAWASSPEGQRVSSAAGAAIGRELAGHDVPRAIVATVRRHEARHAIDIANDEPPADPPALARYVAGKGTIELRARAELSAYVSQIASDPLTPQLALWNLANIGFGASHHGSAESFVAATVIEALARHRGVRGSEVPTVKAGKIDRHRLAELALPLADLSDSELRSAAREVWVDLYHEPLEPIVETSAKLGR